MAPERTRIRNVDWSRHKAIIRRLYLVADTPLKSLVDKLAHLGFPVTRAQLEYQLKKWKFTKNISKQGWRYIDYRVKKRAQQGRKTSQVVFGGRRIKPSTVEKETNRYKGKEVAVPEEIGPPSPTCPRDMDIMVSTPVPISMEFTTWPRSLPWLKLQERHSFIPAPIHEQLQAVPPAGDAIRHLSLGRRGKSYLDPSPGNLLQLAAEIGKTMPEVFENEHVYHAEIISRGAVEEIFEVWIRLLLFRFSNNLVDVSHQTHDDEWEFIANIIRRSGLLQLGAQIDLKTMEQGESVFPAFAEKLFTPAIRWAWMRRGRTPQYHDDILSITRWLLSAGQNPNVSLPSFGYTPVPTSSPAIHVAITSGFVDLVRILIAHGADVFYSMTEHPGYGESRLLSEVTALGAAACAPKGSVGMLELLLATLPTQSVTPHVFIAAADAGNDEILNVLVKLAPGGVGKCNNLGFSPLHAAAFRGRESTCRLLLENGSSADALMSAEHDVPTPLHCAALACHPEITWALIEHGADTNAHFSFNSLAGGRFQQLLLLGDASDDQPAESSMEWLCMTDRPTPLDILTIPSMSWEMYQNKMACNTFIAAAGGRFGTRAVAKAARLGSPDLVLQAIQEGGDPNETSKDGLTALEEALTFYDDEEEGCTIGPIVDTALTLLSAGAIPQEGVLVKALRLRSWSLAESLMSRGAQLDDTSSEGITALEAAFLSGDMGIITKVIERNPTAYEPGALCAAVVLALCKLVEVSAGLETMLWNRPPGSAPDFLEATAVAAVAQYGSRDLLGFLLACIPPHDNAILPIPHLSSKLWPLPHTMGAVLRAIGGTSLPYWRLDVRGEFPRGSPLASAVINGDPDIVMDLLAHGFCPDRLSLLAAAHNGSVSLARLLVYNGEQPRRIPKPDDSTVLPLAVAVRKDNAEMVRFLLECGEDVNETPWRLRFGRTPLQVAVQTGNLEMIDLLFEAGATANDSAVRDSGATALQLAAINGYLGIAKLLLDRGADVDAPRAKIWGRTALQAAAEHGRVDMIELFLAAGAKTTGIYRRQFLRAVCLAEGKGHGVAGKMLRASRCWGSDDEKVLAELMQEKSDKPVLFNQNWIHPNEVLKDPGTRKTTDLVVESHAALGSNEDPVSREGRSAVTPTESFGAPGNVEDDDLGIYEDDFDFNFDIENTVTFTSGAWEWSRESQFCNDSERGKAEDHVIIDDHDSPDPPLVTPVSFALDPFTDWAEESFNWMFDEAGIMEG